MSANQKRPFLRVLLFAVGAAAGLVVALIVTLNLHIIFGFEEGYAATPSDVFERSVFLGVFDILLAVLLPVAGGLGLIRILRL